MLVQNSFNMDGLIICSRTEFITQTLDFLNIVLILSVLGIMVMILIFFRDPKSTSKAGLFP